MVLHTVCHSPYQHGALRQCLRLISAPAALLLMEDGVYAATRAAAELVAIEPAIEIYALQADLDARGISATLNPRVTPIDDRGFVELSLHCARMQAWY